MQTPKKFKLSSEADMSSNTFSIVPSAHGRRESNDPDFILQVDPTPVDKSSTPTHTIHLLSKNLQSVLMPLNMMQAIGFCAKYKIKNNRIIANSITYNIISVFGMCIFTCNYYYFTIGSTFTDDLKGFKYYQYLVKIYIFLVLFMGTLLNCCTNIIQKCNNALFVLKIQDVNTTLSINETLKRFIFPNWVCVIALNFYHISWIFFSYYVIDFLGLGLSFTTHIWLCLDMNILYATRIMKLLTKPLKSWVNNVQKSECVENTKDDIYWNKMFEVYMEILEAYKIFEKTFHQLILYYILVTTSKSMISIVMRIEMKKVTTGSGTSFAVLSFVSLTWIIKNMLLLIFLSVENEEFFSALREVRSACIQLANSSRCSDTQKRICKNIQRIQKTTFKKMRACGLFIIDAELSLHLCALMTTYTIVILQLEFL